MRFNLQAWQKNHCHPVGLCYNALVCEQLNRFGLCPKYKNGIKMHEKRQYHRFRHAQPVAYRFEEADLSTGCLSGDLGAGGLRIRLNSFLALNTSLQLMV